MRSLLIASTALLLSACAVVDSAKTGAPIDQAQLQKDLATALLYLQTAGCVTSQLAAAAAPIVAVAADDQGNKMLTVVGTAGATVCRVAAPAGVVSAPGTTLGAVIGAAP